MAHCKKSVLWVSVNIKHSDIRFMFSFTVLNWNSEIFTWIPGFYVQYFKSFTGKFCLMHPDAQIPDSSLIFKLMKDVHSTWSSHLANLWHNYLNRHRFQSQQNAEWLKRYVYGHTKLDRTKQLKMVITRGHIFVTGFCGQYMTSSLTQNLHFLLLMKPHSMWVGISMLKIRAVLIHDKLLQYLFTIRRLTLSMPLLLHE